MSSRASRACSSSRIVWPPSPEMHRALKRNGRLVAAVWREIALQPSFAALDAALRECLPADQAEPYGAPFRWPRGEDVGGRAA